jgi:hypothetical protein
VPPLRELLIGAVLPGAIAALVLGAAWLLLGRKPQKRPLPRWSVPLAFALAYLPADYAVRSWPEVWPPDSTKRLVHLALLLGIVGVVTSLWRSMPTKARTTVHTLAMGVAMWMPLEALGRRGDTGTMLVWVGGATAAAMGFAFLVGRESERRGGWAPPALAALIVLAASPVLLFGSIATIGQMVGGVVAMLTAAAMVGALSPRFTLHAGGSLVIAGLLTAMLAIGVHFGTAQWISAALILASPLVLWVDRIPLLARRAVWQRFLIEAALVAIPLGVAAAIAHANKPDYDYF